MRPITIDHPNVKLMLRDLEFGPATVGDIASALGVGSKVAYRAIAVARAAKLIHISSWERCRCPRPVYALGRWQDTPRPTPFTVAQTAQRYRDRRKARLARCPEHGLEPPATHAVLYTIAPNTDEWTCQFCGRRWAWTPLDTKGESQ